MADDKQRAATDRSEFLKSMRNGAILGAVVLAIVLPWKFMNSSKQAQPPASVAVAPAPATGIAKPAAAVRQHVPRLANFGNEVASADARHVANWALYSGDNQSKSVVVVDKKAARVYVFSPQGELQGATSALLGSAHGDHTVPGIGDKPLSQVLPEEKTTPAGRFVAELGINTNHEDIVWVDYEAAVSMHRVRPNVKSERRLQRLASATADDNRISFGCINLPVAFYEGILSPTVKRTGAIIYVLPETKTVQEQFASYDVPASLPVAHNVAQHVAQQ